MVTRLAGVLAGVVVGLVAGGATAAVAGRETHRGDGIVVRCTGNGDGGYRRCDVYVDEPGAVRRVDYNLYTGGQWFVGMNVWGINPGKGPQMVDSPLRVDVKR